MKHFLFKKIIYPLAQIYWKIFKPTTKGARSVLVWNHEVLLVKHNTNDFWSLPGGGVHKNEDALIGLYRELWEELRIPSKWIIGNEKLGTYFNQREGKTDTIDIFILNCVDGNFIRGYELGDAKWFPLTSLPNDISPATSRRIVEYLSGKRNFEKVW